MQSVGLPREPGSSRVQCSNLTGRLASGSDITESRYGKYDIHIHILHKDVGADQTATARWLADDVPPINVVHTTSGSKLQPSRSILVVSASPLSQYSRSLFSAKGLPSHLSFDGTYRKPPSPLLFTAPCCANRCPMTSQISRRFLQPLPRTLINSHGRGPPLSQPGAGIQ